MTKQLAFLVGIGIGLSSCSSASLTPGATLLSGLTQYRGEMQALGSSPSRWPERQRLAGNLKTIITATVGGSPEFYRLVDLDIRKREFVVTLRETSVRPDRAREMNDELAQMEDEIAALKPVIRTQLAALPVQSEPNGQIEEAATRGLLSLALEGFSSNGRAPGFGPPSTKAGGFSVTDHGPFSIVRAPDGQTFRCVLFGVAEEGAGIRCEAGR